jgi:hypothetical protein
VERKYTTITGQRHGKDVSAAANKHVIIEDAVSSIRLLLVNGAATNERATVEEPLEAVSSARFMPRLYNDDQLDKLVSRS